MGAHGVAPTWPAQAGRPQGGAQVILDRVGAHRVVPRWFGSSSMLGPYV